MQMKSRRAKHTLLLLHKEERAKRSYVVSKTRTLKYWSYVYSRRHNTKQEHWNFFINALQCLNKTLFVEHIKNWTI